MLRPGSRLLFEPDLSLRFRALALAALLQDVVVEDAGHAQWVVS